MTVPTGTYQTYQTIGNREDLTDIIYNIAPTDTPVMSTIGRGKATNTLHEWQTDTLAAAAANRAVEGDDATILTATPTVRLNNYCQISQKAISVSGTDRAMNPAGRADELSYQIAKRGKELKRDMELAITQNQASSAGSASVARSSASMESWLSSNRTSVGTGTAQTTPGFSSGTVAAPTDSTVAGTVTEAALKAVLQSIFTAGGSPDLIVVGPVSKQKYSTFTGIATQYRENSGVKQATILAAAAVYVSDFGELRIEPDRFSRDRTNLILDTEYWGVSYLRPMQQYELAKTGDSDKRQMLCEWTLESRNEAASGKIADVNPAL